MRPSPPTSSSASPARPRRTSRPRSTSWRRSRFATAFTFQYSKRPGTPAADLPDQLPKAVVQERFERLTALQDRIAAEENAKQVGRTVEVMVTAAVRPQVRGNRTGSPAGPATSAWCTSRCPPARRPRARATWSPCRSPRPQPSTWSPTRRPPQIIRCAARAPATPGTGRRPNPAAFPPAVAIGSRPRGMPSSGHALPALRPRLGGAADARSCPVIAVVGPTGTGKSDLASRLPQELGGEIDQRRCHAVLPRHGHRHRQAPACRTRRDAAPPAGHHGRARGSQRGALPGRGPGPFADIRTRGAVPILVGGSGLYVRAALDEIDFPPTDPAVRQRLEAEAAAEGIGALAGRLARGRPGIRGQEPR